MEAGGQDRDGGQLSGHSPRERFADPAWQEREERRHSRLECNDTDGAEHGKLKTEISGNTGSERQHGGDRKNESAKRICPPAEPPRS